MKFVDRILESVEVVLFTKVRPTDDIGNAILPEEVIRLS